MTRARTVALLASLPLLAIACGAGSGSAGDEDAEPSGATVPDRLETPRGTDPAAVAPYIEDLLVSYNASVNEIAARPSLAVDPDSPAVRAYVGLFEPDSTVATQAVAFWQNQGVVGDATRPYAPGRPAFTTRLDGAVESVGDEEVTFPTCVERAFETVNAQGQRIDVEPGASLAGQGTAVLVDDEWRLRRLDQFAGTEGCGGGS
jgi:hypothetical protein